MAAPSTTPITIRGRYFFRGTERFLIRGVCYQSHPSSRSRNLNNNGRQLQDPIADDQINQLRQDIKLFKVLNLNAILVYTVDNTKCHDLSMKALSDAGIYVLLDLSTPTMSINRAAPLDRYNAGLLEHYFKTIDCFDKYPNVLGVFAGNEVINSPTTSKAAEVVKAVVRDVKEYMRLKNQIMDSRVLPVGYSAASVMSIEKPSAEYFTAGSPKERVDFYAMNNYSWCGPSSLQMSGWDRQIQLLSHIKVPMFWSEYGANARYPSSRIFDEVLALYSPDVTGVLSGGCLYEFHAGANQYGLVKTYPNGIFGTNRDFTNFRQNMAKVVEGLNSHPPVCAQGKEASGAHEVSGREPLLNAAGLGPRLHDPSSESHLEGWLGQFPNLGSWWQATSDIPCSPVDWAAVTDRLQDEDWVKVGDDEVDEQAMTKKPLVIRIKNDVDASVIE